MIIPTSETYRPSFFLRPKHFHTIYASKLRKVNGPIYTRERLETPDADFMDLDWSRQGNDRVVVLMHGLEGSSGRPYIRGFTNVLNSQGWDAVAINFRSCSGEMNRQPYSYHSGVSHDLATVLVHIQDQYPTIAAIGFSLGGNVLLKYLGEAKSETPLRAAVAFSVPCDLRGSSIKLMDRTNKLYMWNFLRLLREKVIIKAAMFPGLISAEGFNQISSFQEFDDRYTAPLNGFKDADDYWSTCSSKGFIPDIQIPTLLVNAKDDPFLSDSCYPIEQTRSNPHVTLEIPRFGGHVAFHQKGLYWSEERTMHFLREII